MKIPPVLVLFIAGCISCITPAFSQQNEQPLEMKVLFSPDIVMISGKPTVYYELHLTSHASDSIRLQKLDIYTNKDVLVAAIDKNELRKKYSGGKDAKVEQENILPPSATGIIYIEVIVPGNSAGRLKHQLSFETIQNHTAGQQTIEGGVTGYSQQTPIVVGPPLSGGEWAAVYEPSWQRGHRRVVYAPDGKSRIPGRFAIDFIKLDQQGKYTTGEENEIKNWYGYGIPVIAVADGIVASTRDDFPESPTLSGHPLYPSEKATGNYVSIDIGNGHIVFYEHLQPGSVKVKAGQAVKKGAVIANLGFTGQTTGPHLHFHIANANSPLGAEGIPFVFERFTLVGTYPDFSKFGKAPWTPAQGTAITRERPAPNTVIGFIP